MPSPFQIRRYAQVLIKHLGLQGHLPTTLVEDVAPTIELIDTNRPEFLFLKGERVWARGAIIAAVVGQFSRVTLTNPAGSNRLIVVQGLIFQTDVAATVNWGILFASADTGGHILVPLDTRVATEAGGLTGRSVGTVNASTNAVRFFAGSDPIEALPTTVGQATRVQDVDVVLVPGTGVIAETSAANVTLQGYWRWRELDPAPQELQPGG